MECYRGRQGWLNHAAYMRMAKVLLTQRLCREAGISFEGKDIFDYGFGAGTFFRYCPQSARLFGVEMDAENVNSVRAMLQGRGFANVDLQTIEIAHWETHPLLARKYDIILCSHVLEHLPDPTMFLKTIRESLHPAGVFLGLVPINERLMDPHHVQRLDKSKIHAFAADAGLRVKTYLETDHWLYWFQPIFASERGFVHKVAQAVSLALGVPATIAGARAWFAAARVYSVFTKSKPTQAAFALMRDSTESIG
jgi:2-polyprenyl-3-methyl-5-hydroxy-6-metoxy-1,4-benzoquinol methylase